MSHRETYRVRTSQYDRLDQEAATRVMSREWRGVIPRREVPGDVQEHGETPAVVQARLVRDAVMPGALAVTCPACGTEPGAYCTTGILSVCHDRALSGVRAAAT